jgi:hypothetical protein
MATVQNRAGGEVKQAAANPTLELLERLGYVVRGALYVVMGFLALKIALATPGGKATDLSGSLVWLIGNPFGKVVLVVTIIGLVAYALWGIVRAIYDPLHRGRDAKGIMARLGFVTSAVSYMAIALFALHILAGQGAASGDSTQSYRATFAQDLKAGEMTQSERNIAIALGRFGMAARGVTFLVIGWFLIQAGLHHAPSKATGFGGAFLFLLAQPYGRWLLGVVALGFIALGVHSLACARWVRLLGSSAN